MEIALLEEEVVTQLWMAYKKTPQYRSGLNKAIPSDHKLVIANEKEGLMSIYRKFVNELESFESNKDKLRGRHPSEWISEWKNMHKCLFEHILKISGEYRKTQVRFGNPEDEELYKIPDISNLHNELSFLAQNLSVSLKENYADNISKFVCLAKIHYQFIRIHPFTDGNGRIARAITDQLAIFFDFPPAMAGYPRNNKKRRIAYHKAIKSCTKDPDCTDLALWIRSYVERQINEIA